MFEDFVGDTFDDEVEDELSDVETADIVGATNNGILACRFCSATVKPCLSNCCRGVIGLRGAFVVVLRCVNILRPQFDSGVAAAASAVDATSGGGGEARTSRMTDRRELV